MTINFECKKCQKEFDCDVGKIGIDDSGMHPTFGKDIVCPLMAPTAEFHDFEPLEAQGRK